MKALSIRQPWAWLIAHGYKDIENREWRTGFRGRFLIHAGLQVDRMAYTVFRDFYDLPEIDDLPTGGIVGSADLKECVDQHPSPWFEGPFGFVLDGAESCGLIPCRGQLYFFNARI